MRHRPCDGSALPPDCNPTLDECLVRSGGDAQFGDLPVAGSVLGTFAEAERDAGAFGQQIGPPGRRLFQLGDRRGFLVGGEPRPGRGVRQPRRSARTGDGQDPGLSSTQNRI